MPLHCSSAPSLEYGKTKTEVVALLIDSAGTQEEWHRENLKKMKRQIRHSILNADALKAEQEETKKQLEMRLQELAAWEATYGNEPPETVDEEATKKSAENKMCKALRAIRSVGDQIRPLSGKPTYLRQERPHRSNLVDLSGALPRPFLRDD